MARPRGSRDSKPRRKKTRDDAPGAAGLGEPGIGHNSDVGPGRLTPDEERELFFSHRQQWGAYQNKLKAAEEFGSKVKAALKADGFFIEEMKIADDLGNPKGEKRVVDNIAMRLRVARWIGHEMGRQADLFEQPERTPLIERAYEDGKQASIEGRPMSPPHAPETEAYRAWMQGFGDHQEELAKRVGSGAERTNSLRETIARGDQVIQEAADAYRNKAPEAAAE